MNKLIKFDTKCFIIKIINICLFLIFPLICLSNTLPKTAKSFERVDVLVESDIHSFQTEGLKITIKFNEMLLPEVGDTLYIIEHQPIFGQGFYKVYFDDTIQCEIKQIENINADNYQFEIEVKSDFAYFKNQHLTSEKLLVYWQKKTVTTFSYTENEGGNFLHEGSFFNDMPVGKHIHIENETKIETHYVLGQKHGVEKIYKNDKLTKEINWFLDKKSGYESIYYLNGNLKEKNHYINNKKEGLCETYYESGNHQSISFYKENILQGNHKYYYENGQLKNDVIYIEGKLEGEAFGFYEDGKIQLKCSYSNGEFHGKFLRKFANDKPEVETNFNNGKINGKYIDFYESGKKKSKGIYTENQKIGKWVYWDEKGKKRIEKIDK